MSTPAEKLKERYTYTDYITWDDDIRYELIDGIPYAMASPSQFHQLALSELHAQFRDFLKNKPCYVFSASADVRLSVSDLGDDVFQPDLYVTCDFSKMDGQSLRGAPDLAIEILSPSTADRDRKEKYSKYLAAKVPEYWIIDLTSRSVSVFTLKNDIYDCRIYGAKSKIVLSALQGCEIDMEPIFSAVDILENIIKKNMEAKNE